MASRKYDGMKIGQIAQTYLIEALQNGAYSTAEIEEFLDRSFSRQTFGLGYSLLSEERRIDDKGRARDYAKPITINGELYFLCSQWTEGPSREKLITWLDNQGGAAGKASTGTATKGGASGTTTESTATKSAAAKSTASKKPTASTDTDFFFCSKCGNKITDMEAVFCSKCGAKVSAPQDEQPTKKQTTKAPEKQAPKAPEKQAAKIPAKQTTKQTAKQDNSIQARAERGDSDAQLKLGAMYYNGDGIPEDEELAAYWYTKAAEQGNSDAQYRLGDCYYKGNGVPQDIEQTLYWWKKAAEQGNVDAQNNVGSIYISQMDEPEKALPWFIKAAEQGSPLAQYSLGAMHVYGSGVEQDYEKGAYWLKKSAEQGVEQAEEMLRGLAEDGLIDEGRTSIEEDDDGEWYVSFDVTDNDGNPVQAIIGGSNEITVTVDSNGNPSAELPHAFINGASKGGIYFLYECAQVYIYGHVLDMGRKIKEKKVLCNVTLTLPFDFKMDVGDDEPYDIEFTKEDYSIDEGFTLYYALSKKLEQLEEEDDAEDIDNTKSPPAPPKTDNKKEYSFFIENQENIFPLIRNEQSGVKLTIPFFDDMIICFGVDNGRMVTMLERERVPPSVTTEQLIKLAMSNFKRKFAGNIGAGSLGAGTSYICAMDDNTYTPTLLLETELIRNLANRTGDDLVISIPARDRFLYAAASDPKAIATLKKDTATEHATRKHVSKTLLLYDRNSRELSIYSAKTGASKPAASKKTAGSTPAKKPAAKKQPTKKAQQAKPRQTSDEPQNMHYLTIKTDADAENVGYDSDFVGDMPPPLLKEVLRLLGNTARETLRSAKESSEGEVQLSKPTGNRKTKFTFGIALSPEGLHLISDAIDEGYKRGTFDLYDFFLLMNVCDNISERIE